MTVRNLHRLKYIKDIVTISNVPSNSGDTANVEVLLSVLVVYWFIFPFLY